jgi:hypothetical protein
LERRLDGAERRFELSSLAFYQFQIRLILIQTKQQAKSSACSERSISKALQALCAQLAFILIQLLVHIF